MSNMHRAPGLQFPKGTPPKVDREARRRAFVARDRKGSRQARSRAAGRCEAVVNGLRCVWQGRHVHHMVGGIGKRGHGISALAERKQLVCFGHHKVIHQNNIARIGGNVPHYTDTYKTKGRPDMARKSAKLQPVHEPDVVGQYEHLELVRTLQGGITSFFQGAGVFFKGASVLREEAKLMLARAEVLTVPTNDASDKIVQRVVIDSTKGRKANTEHWEPITKTFHKVHKVLTGGRSEAEKDFASAASIGNRHHSDYVAEQERKARIEQQRLDRLAREAAQRERDEENRRLEEERLTLEADSPNLSDREQRFVNAYDRSGNAIQAERMAGYKAGYGAKLLEREKIQTALELLAKTREVARQQEIVKTAPIIPKATAVVRSTVSHVVGAGSRKQRGANVYDEAALIEAILMQAANPPPEGEPIIPTDVLTIKAPRVNEYARKLGRAINEWPGVRFTEETKVTGS